MVHAARVELTALSELVFLASTWTVLGSKRDLHLAILSLALPLVTVGHRALPRASPGEEVLSASRTADVLPTRLKLHVTGGM
uniref:Structural maintenance of chromosomes protein n=1 Tax=Ganoderma boninense TaxID=34458 RepID=A0A5K1JYQ9_9APHY|nr:Structural maintenance of chromosomes protein [Ganoderma boninense]